MPRNRNYTCGLYIYCLLASDAVYEEVIVLVRSVCCVCVCRAQKAENLNLLGILCATVNGRSGYYLVYV